MVLGTMAEGMALTLEYSSFSVVVCLLFYFPRLESSLVDIS